MAMDLRTDIRSSVICVWETILYYKKYWKNIENYQCYLSHQQSMSFVKGLMTDKDAKIEKYNKNNRLLDNCQKSWNLTKDSKISDYLRHWKNKVADKIKTYSAKEYECPKKLETPELEPYKPEQNYQQLDKLKVAPKPVKVDYGELMLKDAGVDKDMLEKMKAGEIAAIEQASELSPGPNAKQQTPVNGKKINIDKQTLPVG